MTKKALVLGGGGFIGNHLVDRLKSQGVFVRVVDLKEPEFCCSNADEFIIGDLREWSVCQEAVSGGFEEVYQLAADMGGAGYIFTGDNDAAVMHNSALINLHITKLLSTNSSSKVFYSSSACIYPEFNQLDPENPVCVESSAYPAQPDSEYGWEKLFSERLYASFMRNYGLDVRIARFHNVYGPLGTYDGGKEKAPAALCRKVAMAQDGEQIEVWGDGIQTRSFLYIDDCLDGIQALMKSSYSGPVNIGSEEMVSINDFAKMIIGLSGKNISLKNIPGPQGVRGRRSDNGLVKETTGWSPSISLLEGLRKTYSWIENQIKAK